MPLLRAIVIFLPLFVLLCGCNQNDPPYEPGPRPVTTMVVEEPRQAVTRSFSGTAKAATDTVLSFRVSGSLQSLPVQVGQRVRAGERIARLDPTDYHLKVMELEARLAQVRAGFTKARADYERVRGLYEVGNVSKSNLDQAQAGFESARAGLEAARKNLELVEQQLAYTSLHAPISGTVSAMPVENFQTVQAGQPIAVLSTDEDLEFEVGLPDHLIRFIALGDQARVTFDVLPDPDLARQSQRGEHHSERREHLSGQAAA